MIIRGFIIIFQLKNGFIEFGLKAKPSILYIASLWPPVGTIRMMSIHGFIIIIRLKGGFIEFGLKAKPSISYVGFVTLAARRNDQDDEHSRIHHYNLIKRWIY